MLRDLTRFPSEKPVHVLGKRNPVLNRDETLQLIRRVDQGISTFEIERRELGVTRSDLIFAIRYFNLPIPSQNRPLGHDREVTIDSLETLGGPTKEIVDVTPLSGFFKFSDGRFVAISTGRVFFE